MTSCRGVCESTPRLLLITIIVVSSMLTNDVVSTLDAPAAQHTVAAQVLQPMYIVDCSGRIDPSANL